MKAMGDTGVPETLIGYVLGNLKGTRALLFGMFTSVAFLSGLFNNTPIVVMMIPVLQSLCQRRGLAPRALLMPLSFAAQAGGSLTLMGSSINFVAQEVFASKGYHITFFTLSLGGVIIVCFGAVYCSVLGPRLLANSSRHSPSAEPAVRKGSAKEHFTLFLRVQGASPLVGICVRDVGLHRIPGVQAVLALHRDLEETGTSSYTHGTSSTVEMQQLSEVQLQNTASPNRFEYRGWDQLADLNLQDGDLLQISCSAAGAACVRRVKGLELSNEDEVQRLGAQRRSRSLCEAAVHENMVGTSVDVSWWRKELRCAILSAKGGRNRDHPPNFQNYTLQVGDVLLVEAFRDMVGSDIWLQHFGVVRVEPNSAPPRFGQKADLLRAVFIVIGLIVLISLASLGYKKLTMPLMSVIFLCGIIAVKGLKMEEAYGEVNGQVLLTIVGALVLGKAMEASCLASCAGQFVVFIARPLGSTAVCAGVYCVTIALGQFLNSAANVAIMGQVALSVAEEMQIPVGEIAMVVTYAASACYMAPYGYQTNTLVMMAGDYDWGEFIKFGGFMQLLHMCVVLSIASWCAKVSPVGAAPM